MIYLSLSARLKTQHLAIHEILRPVAPDRLHVRPANNKWCVHDNIAHLSCYQIHFEERLHRILTKELPIFERYVADDDKEFEVMKGKGLVELLSFLTDHRARLNNFILSLNDVQLSRIGSHRKYGAMNLVQWTEFFYFMRRITFLQYFNLQMTLN